MNELPSDLRRLLEGERGVVPAAPAGAQKRVLARVGSTVGLAAGAAAVASAATNDAGGALAAARVGAVAGVARWGLAFLLGVAVSSLVYFVLRDNRPRVVEIYRAAPAAPAQAPLVPGAAVTAAAPVIAAEATPAAALAAHDRAHRHVHAAAPAPVVNDLAAERALLESARSALALGDPRAALVAVRLHEHRFAHGQLSEERESLAIRALVADHQAGAARARADAFRGRFPGSIFLPAVDAVLGSAP